MLIIFRAWYFVGIAGIGCAVFGGRELTLALAAATEPEAISMYDLEQGKRPSQPFVSLDSFYAVYGATSYETKKSRVQDAVYPMLSEQHPWCLAWDELAAKYDDLEKVPNGEFPKLERIKVMGLTSEFDKLSDIPDEGRMEQGAIGIFYTYDELSSDEQELVAMIEQHHPKDVVVIEIGRKPKSVMFGAVVSLIGAVLGLLAITLFFKKRAAESADGDEDQGEEDQGDEDQGEDDVPTNEVDTRR